MTPICSSLYLPILCLPIWKAERILVSVVGCSLLVVRDGPPSSEAADCWVSERDVILSLEAAYCSASERDRHQVSTVEQSPSSEVEDCSVSERDRRRASQVERSLSLEAKDR